MARDSQTEKSQLLYVSVKATPQAYGGYLTWDGKLNMKSQEKGNNEDREVSKGARLQKSLKAMLRSLHFMMVERESFKDFSQESDIIRHSFFKTPSFEMRRA